MGEEEISEHLSCLATEQKVFASTKKGSPAGKKW